VLRGVQVYPNATALVVSTENITQNIYLGKQRSMCIPGCIFRIGGAAVLLSNRRRDAWRAKCAAPPAARAAAWACWRAGLPAAALLPAAVHRSYARCGEVTWHVQLAVPAARGGRANERARPLGPSGGRVWAPRARTQRARTTCLSEF